MCLTKTLQRILPNDGIQLPPPRAAADARGWAGEATGDDR